MHIIQNEQSCERDDCKWELMPRKRLVTTFVGDPYYEPEKEQCNKCFKTRKSLYSEFKIKTVLIYNERKKQSDQERDFINELRIYREAN